MDSPTLKIFQRRHGFGLWWYTHTSWMEVIIQENGEYMPLSAKELSGYPKNINMLWGQWVTMILIKTTSRQTHLNVTWISTIARVIKPHQMEGQFHYFKWEFYRLFQLYLYLNLYACRPCMLKLVFFFPKEKKNVIFLSLLYDWIQLFSKTVFKIK